MARDALTSKQAAFLAEYGVDPDAFWRQVDVVDGADCWNWKAAKDPTGYGRLRVAGRKVRTMLAHRVAFGLVHGVLTEAICHSCDNPSCCNPAHLIGATRAFNNRDMAAKRRHAAHTGTLEYPRGVAHHNAKLSQEQAEAMRLVYERGGVTQRELARRFGVSQRTANKVLRGMTYAAA